MFRTVVGIFGVVALGSVLCQTIAAADLRASYYESIGRYYSVTADEVLKISRAGISDEDLPVVFFIADRAKAEPGRIAQAFLGGTSWMDVCRNHSLYASDFYLIVSGKVTSRNYGPTFAKFKNTPEPEWKEIELTNDEIVNLVNLKLMYSLHDYSVYEIMAMRDYGKTFPTINHQVILAKKEMNEKQKQILEAR